MFNLLRNSFSAKVKQQDKCDISGNAYKSFVYYALKESDYFTFHLPNYNHFYVTEKNINLLPNEMKCDINNLTDNVKDNEIFNRYKKNVTPLIDLIRNQIVFSYYDVSYLNNIFNYGTEVFIIRIIDFDSCYRFFTAAESVFSWKFDSFSEDICFFSDEKCWLQIVSHEQLIMFKGKAEQEETLKKYGIAFLNMKTDIELPTIKGTIGGGSVSYVNS